MSETKPSPSASAASSDGSAARLSPAPGAQPTAQVPARASGESTPPPALTCPEGMALLPGGKFWMGSRPHEHFSADESPRFLTELAPFCMGVTEVSAGAYTACVGQGRCAPPVAKRRSCTFGRPGREQHPINCVTFDQAEAYCVAQGTRLPTEAEWEYAARGGPEYRRYPWGAESPDGHACWKHNGTCPAKQFEAGAFGLYDVSGNVWEWTDTWYGPYPFPPEQAFAKVYRGGSYSRRFEKWMHTRLRNRALPRDEGSHLGFRCAQTPAGASCPAGQGADGKCLHVVLEAECAPGEQWNGARCARVGAPRCAPGLTEKAGYGCVPPGADQSGTPRAAASGTSLAGSAKPESERRARSAEESATLADVRRSRSPEFDADCQENQPKRPHAYRYVGGTHAARNLTGKQAGCKNRDVGVGWNSACCP